jgi:hypothetical protein
MRFLRGQSANAQTPPPKANSGVLDIDVTATVIDDSIPTVATAFDLPCHQRPANRANRVAPKVPDRMG